MYDISQTATRQVTKLNSPQPQLVDRECQATTKRQKTRVQLIAPRDWFRSELFYNTYHNNTATLPDSCLSSLNVDYLLALDTHPADVHSRACETAKYLTRTMIEAKVPIVQ